MNPLYNKVVKDRTGGSLSVNVIDTGLHKSIFVGTFEDSEPQETDDGEEAEGVWCALNVQEVLEVIMNLQEAVRVIQNG